MRVRRDSRLQDDELTLASEATCATIGLRSLLLVPSALLPVIALAAELPDLLRLRRTLLLCMAGGRLQRAALKDRLQARDEPVVDRLVGLPLDLAD